MRRASWSRAVGRSAPTKCWPGSDGLWPEEADLVALTAACGSALPLFDSPGDLLGHLAALNPGPAHRLSEAERLKSLVRVAASELERWAPVA